MSRFTPVLESNLRNAAVGTSSTAAQAIYTLADGTVPGNVIWIYNEGSQVAFVRLGSASVGAATVGTASVAGSIPVAPGQDVLIDEANQYTHFRAITATGTTTLNVAVGFLDK